MYILTIKYLDGSDTINFYETFPQVKEKINTINKPVESIDMYFESPENLDPSNIDETSHLSWGI